MLSANLFCKVRVCFETKELDTAMTRILFLSLISLCALTTNAQQVWSTPSSQPSWRSTPATPSGVVQRMEDAAVSEQDLAPVPRRVFYDIAYPGNDDEFTALDGHAIMLLTALSQRREELPLVRVFVVMEDGTEVSLKQVRLVLSERSIPGSLVTKVFGRFRADTLYMLPVYLRMKPVDLMVEYGGRNRMKVTRFGTSVSGTVSRLKIAPPTGVGPSDSILNAYIKREFPGF